MNYTPYVVIAGLVLFVFLWKNGTISAILGRLRGSSQPAYGVAPVQNRSAAQANPSVNPDDLARYDSFTLGMAYQKAIRREADEELQREMAEKNRRQAMTTWQAPFGSPPTPGPPSPGPGAS